MIKWITSYLATSSFEYAYNIGGDFTIVDVRDLVDKQGNSLDLIQSKLNESVNIIQNNKKVVICCDYGISRSNSIAIGAYSIIEKLSFNESARLVLSKLDYPEIKLTVLHQVRQAVEGTATKNKSKKILLLGGSGSVGTAIQECLVDKLAFVAPNSELLNLLNGSVNIDLFIDDYDVQSILYCAFPRKSGTNDSVGTSINMLKNVLDVCVQRNIKFYFISDIAIFNGLQNSLAIITENSKPIPKTSYAEAKWLAESLITHYGEIFSLKYLIIRSSMLFGFTSKKPKFLNNLITKLKLNTPEIVMHKYINDFPAIDLLHVKDFVDVLYQLVSANVEGLVNVGSGKLSFLKELVEKTINICKLNSKVLVQEVNDTTANIYFDLNRLKSLLSGWNPKYDIVSYISQTLSEGKDESTKS